MRAHAWRARHRATSARADRSSYWLARTPDSEDPRAVPLRGRRGGARAVRGWGSQFGGTRGSNDVVNWRAARGAQPSAAVRRARTARGRRAPCARVEGSGPGSEKLMLEAASLVHFLISCAYYSFY